MKTKYLVIIVLALLAATVSAFYYSDLPALDLGVITFHHRLSPSATTTPPSTASSSPAVISGWKTYANSQYGFSFEYPSDWYPDDQSSTSTIELLSPATRAAQGDFEIQPYDIGVLILVTLRIQILLILHNHMKRVGLEITKR